jgi:hypothetical protein
MTHVSVMTAGHAKLSAQRDIELVDFFELTGDPRASALHAFRSAVLGAAASYSILPSVFHEQHHSLGCNF